MITMTIKMMQDYDDHENGNEDEEYVGICCDGKLSYDFNDLMAITLTTTTTITKTVTVTLTTSIMKTVAIVTLGSTRWRRLFRRAGGSTWTAGPLTSTWAFQKIL